MGLPAPQSFNSIDLYAPMGLRAASYAIVLRLAASDEPSLGRGVLSIDTSPRPNERELSSLELRLPFRV